MHLDLLVVIVVITALAFDFTNGFHDTANAMATSIATGALKPRVAVAISAVLNLVGAFLSVQVAKTISGGIVDDSKIGPAVVFGGLIGAIVWNLLTWFVGLPSSSTHALYGGLIGATWIASGENAVHFTTVLEKVVIPAVASPVVAGIIATIATFLAYRLTDRSNTGAVTSGFRFGQMISASMVSLAHGTNDAQKTMGVITLTLITVGTLPSGSAPPLWVIVACGLAIATGTYLGGWRIIRTLGKGITDVETRQGFSAETTSAAVILASSHLGFSLSTTHVVSGGVIGSGIGKRLAEVRWGTAGKMVVAWVITLPAAAVVGAIAGKAADSGTGGTIGVAIIGAAFAAVIYVTSRRNKINADNVVELPAAEKPEPATVAA